MDILDDSSLAGREYEAAAALLSDEETFGEFLPPSRLRRSGRRHWQEPVLNITSFVDVLSVLLFFLLSVATLEKLGSHNVNLPRQSEAFATESTVEVKNLTLALSLGGLKLRGIITPQGREPELLTVEMPIRDGRYDLQRLQQELSRIKSGYKTDDAIILMVGDDVNFDSIVKVMDTVRERIEGAKGERRITTLFPEVSLSDYLVESEA